MKFLSEKAMSTADASQRKLGLVVLSPGRERFYIIYDVESFATSIELMYGKAEKRKRLGIGAVELSKRMNGSIVATMSTRKRPGSQWDAAEVTSSAAEKGWGPLIYDIAMAMEGGLLPDRGTVKPGARNIWAHFFNNRNDVRPSPLDDEEDPKTDEKEDDTRSLYGDYDSENPLDYAYFSSQFPQTATMSANHQAGIGKSGLSAEEYENALLDTSLNYFTKRYHEG